MPESPSSGPRIDVIALVTSAGGLDALSTVLRDLPPNLPAAVVVEQHLGGQASHLVPILARRAALPVQWAQDGEAIAVMGVTVCPPRSVLEILPDRTCSLRKSDGRIREHPLDQLLTSIADSFGPRALAVILTGMGQDGAAGARALKEAGGTVIVQSEDTAEHPSMPLAAIASGAADLILPLHEIGRVLTSVMAGERFPIPRNEIEAAEDLFRGPGDARKELRAIDWSTSPLGPVSGWPPCLKLIVRAALDNEFGMIVMWGPDLVSISNDAFSRSLATKQLQGIPARVAWTELWDYVGPRFERVERTGQAVYEVDALLTPNRRGYIEEAYFTYCYSPLSEGGKITGILATFLETTERVIAERRLETLRALSSAALENGGMLEVSERLIGALGENPHDIPFALLYLVENREQARLAAAAGVAGGGPIAPRLLPLETGHPTWPLGKVASEGTPLKIDDLPARFRGFHAGPWPEAPTSALLLPLRSAAQETMAGVLVLGISPRHELDARNRSFFELVAARIADALDDAGARQRERERMEHLAGLDRAKTEFFQNVSHEFRTPLTLLLAPLEEALRRSEELPGPLAGELEVAARNARRLLTLVDTLLDFSQMESGRLRAHFEPTDLAALTADLAGVFRSAVERAGLRLRVDCPPLPTPVWVDREMWERVVSNLLSNALKFTFEGEITVELRALPHHAELVVRDTGVGIPEAELPHLFKRFHRVRGLRARTHEGSGIGLALVDELVRRHHGRIRVKSREGEGTTFTVWVPLARRPKDQQTSGKEGANGKAEVAAALAEEAAQWHAEEAPPAEVLDDPLGVPRDFGLKVRAFGARVLVVDDNADVRAYLRRLLAANWEVETAADGLEALEKARRSPPGLILADVMMPNLDGFGLLREIRRDEALKTTPVILVTARAGEEAAVEGILAGADDYLAKPFSARELIARVGAQLELARVRREAGEAIAQREERFRRALEIETVGVIFWDERVTITGANDAFLRMTGFSRDELIGKSWRELTPAEFHPVSERVIARIRETGHAEPYEKQYARKDGSRWWGVLALQTLGEGEIVEFVVDITDRKEAEAAVRESEARLAAVFEALPVGVGVVDPHGTLVLANREMQRYLPTGVIPSLDDARPVHWRAWNPDGLPVERNDFPGVRALRGETAVPGLEMLYTEDDGTEVWTQVSAMPIRDGEGRITGAVTVVTDTDILKRAERALRERTEEALRISEEERLEMVRNP